MSRHCYLLSTIALFMLLANSTQSRAQESFAGVAKALQASTVTLRVTPSANKTPTLENADKQPAPPKVTVFSGVCLGNGVVVTPLFAATSSSIRITIPGGAQATADPLVLDQHSGLALLKMSDTETPGVKLAAELPEAGEWAISGAGWGPEKAVVSLGVVAGVNRAISGANYPPLIQLDLRTAETSSGAGVANRKGELTGIIVAAEDPRVKRGWTYAAPASHIQRMLRALKAHQLKHHDLTAQADDKTPAPSKVLVIQRRRPVVGVVLGGTAEGAVVVERVKAGSPAAAAGLVVGDELIAVDGVNVRSVYQAVRPVLFKQPGDEMHYTVQQNDTVRTLRVVLGGGVLLPPAPSVELASYVQPRVVVESPGPIKPGAQIAEVSKGPADEPAAAPAEPAATADEKIALLQKAIDGYRNALVFFQGKLVREKQARTETTKRMEQLEAEIKDLKKQLDEVQP